MNERFEQQLGLDILQAARSLGSSIEHAEELTQLRSNKNGKACFKLTLADGRIVKARRYRLLQNREGVVALYPMLSGLPFNQLLAFQNSATIEEWILGKPITSEDLNDSDVELLASVLGELHTRKIPTEVSFTETPNLELYQTQFAKQLQALREKNFISEESRSIVLEHDLFARKELSGQGMLHTDYHPHNMVRDAVGKIWIIDNERIRLGAYDFDIARTWRQWPMDPAQREIFCKAYSNFRSLETFFQNEKLWSLSTLAHASQVRLRFKKNCETLISKFTRIISDLDEPLWPEEESEIQLD